VPKMSSTALNRDYSALVALITMWEFETNSVENGLLGVSLMPPTGKPEKVPHGRGHARFRN